jgi:hypothetical protein
VESEKVTEGAGQLAPPLAVAVPVKLGLELEPIQAVTLDGQEITGFVLQVAQLTVTLNAHVLLLPQLSVAV